MLWTTLLSWTGLCLAGFVGGDYDYDFIYWYPGKRKLASAQDYSVPEDYYLDDYIDDYQELREVQTTVNDGQRVRFMGTGFLEKYLASTTLILYTRNEKAQFIRASNWFQHFDNDKDLVVLVHGVSTEDTYVENFFNTIAHALLKNSDYNVIAIDWRYFTTKERYNYNVEKNIEEAIKIGDVLNSVVERALNAKHSTQVPRTTYIGHDLGCVPVVVQTFSYGFVFDSVYGLNPRPNLGRHDYLTLTQLNGRLVHTLSTVKYPHSLSHRNYRPIYNKDFYYIGNYGNLAYEILAEAIEHGNITARFCSTEEDYLRGYCSKIEEVPLWSKQMSLSCGNPVGKYFFELPSPKLRPYSGDQSFIQMGHC